MDRFIEQFAKEDGDLILCHRHGVAFQRDMTVSAQYDEGYWNKCAGYEGQEIAERINAGRIALVGRHFGDGEVLDIGIGSGEFIKKRPMTYGFDVNPVAVEWLKDSGLYEEDLTKFRAFTMWDVIEHVPDPGVYFNHMPVGTCLFTSIPIFKDLARIRESRHYRPGEHLYYFTNPGLIEWMALHKFALMERQDFEIQAGRDSIYSYAFTRIG